MSRKPLRYQVYVMRMWQEQTMSPEYPATWRFTLEEPKTGQRRGFRCLDELTVFLNEQIAGMDINDRRKSHEP